MLNTDAEMYGGSGVGNAPELPSQEGNRHGRPHFIKVTLPPLAVVAFRVAREDKTAVRARPL